MEATDKLNRHVQSIAQLAYLAKLKLTLLEWWQMEKTSSRIKTIITLEKTRANGLMRCMLDLVPPGIIREALKEDLASQDVEAMHNVIVELIDTPHQTCMEDLLISVVREYKKTEQPVEISEQDKNLIVLQVREALAKAKNQRVNL